MGFEHEEGISVTTTAPSGTIALNKITTVRSRSTGGVNARGIAVLGGSAVTIQNNFIAEVLNIGSASFGTSFNANGILLNSGNSHKVYHNSVNLFGVSTSTGSNSINCLAIAASSQTGIDVRNNIFANQVTGGAATDAHVGVFLPFAASGTMLLNLNNNAYYTGSIAGKSGVAFAGASSYAAANVYSAANFDPTLTTPSTNFRSFSSSLGVATNDNASKVVDPLVPPSTDLHIAVASPMVDMGVNVGVTKDIDGQLRVPPPDIGADEPSGVTPPANDMQATAFVDPTNGGSKLAGASFSPQASFTNNGTATQTSVTVRYKIIDASRLTFITNSNHRFDCFGCDYYGHLSSTSRQQGRIPSKPRRSWERILFRPTMK